MKLQELNNQELTQINGGGLFGNGGDSASESGLLGSLNIGSLLSFSSSSQDGDESSSTSFSLGDGISLDLGSMFRSITQ